ncbi:uroporphyrinogen-III synthase [Sinomicrobium weinanense]|uniref:Uroporphyrinogen-III synthase n=1 Tax=Sinomicrobium weinanense TaxID=2842200 RepID=A0A926Q276_9FLAO|nr:uroporphyrinogen-III synthase [Sinomicrobium weinanense]MBC9794621.1 uroporphyrinogen-III synthase [Sinomicrobium weinanense]MBU3124106.1 uroporphyrinogen-III synthase [Sinomicrobium weinanense]
MQDTLRILSTKKLLPCQKDLLLHAGFQMVEADFIKVEYRDVDLSQVRDHLIFTSRNAVKSVLQHKGCGALKQKNCFCVGKKTRALLEQNGFNVITYTDYAAALAAEILQKYAHLSFTFFSGNLRRGDLPDTLTRHNIDFNEIESYTTRLTPHEIKTPVSGILFFSPSGIRSYLEKNTINDEVCFCIGTTTAGALEKITKNIVIANTPDVESTIASTAKYFKKI